MEQNEKFENLPPAEKIKSNCEQTENGFLLFGLSKNEAADLILFAAENGITIDFAPTPRTIAEKSEKNSPVDSCEIFLTPENREKIFELLEIKISKIKNYLQKLLKFSKKKVKKEIDANLENSELKKFLALQDFNLSTLSRFHEFLPTPKNKLRFCEIKDQEKHDVKLRRQFETGGKKFFLVAEFKTKTELGTSVRPGNVFEHSDPFLSASESFSIFLEDENGQKIYSDENPEMVNFLKEKINVATKKAKNKNKNFKLEIHEAFGFSVKKEPQNFSAEFVNNLLDSLEN